MALRRLSYRAAEWLGRLRWFALVCLLVFATGMAWTYWHPEFRVEHAKLSPHLREASLNTWGTCLREAAYASGVDPALFRAIIAVESGQHPYAFGWYDEKGVRRSYRAATYTEAAAYFDTLEQRRIRFDVGLAQVNSRNLQSLYRRTGIAPIRALDPCTNLHLAGIILKEQIGAHGATWRAVAEYNGAIAYVPKVHRVYCLDVPDDPSCRTSHSLSALLRAPIPVAQTEQYYRPFFRRWL